MRLKKFLLSNFDQWALVLIAATLPWNIPIGNGVLITVVVLGVLLSIYKGEWSWVDEWKTLLPVGVFFLLIIISSMTSDNATQALKQIDKALLLPLVSIAVLRFYRYTSMELLTKAMAYSTAMAVLILLIIASLRYSFGQGTGAFFFHSFTEPINQHAVYFSLTALMSLLFYGEFAVPFIKSKMGGRGSLLLIVLLVLGVILCASKVVIAMTIILLPLYAIGPKINPIVKRMSLTLALALFTIGLSLGPIRNRFVDGLALRKESVKPAVNVADTYEYSLEEVGKISDLEVRLIFIRIGAFHWWHDQQYIWGYGIGDVQDHLNYYYYVYGLAKGGYLNFNLHNQYLQTLVGMGIVGFLALLWLLWTSFRSAIGMSNGAHLTFLLIMSVVFLFECVLSRNKGILIFFFFNTIFLLKNLTVESSYLRDTRYT